MDYGDVVAFCAYATQLLGPVVRFASLANQIVQVGVSADRIHEILDREPAVQEARDAEPLTTLEGDLHIEGLTFGYDPANPVLKSIDLEIPAGSHVAIVGSPGSGRTTLGALLRRFYDPTKGQIAVDRKDIRRLRLRDYRQAIALILPEAAIFDGTIRGNLCYGKPDATEEHMSEVATAVGLADFIDGLGDGYDTRVGAGGLKVSAGIQQQIGIARALISEPLILIADEATASLDPDTAEAVNQAIRDAMKGHTCIIIVSRVLMARGADQVAVMDHGRLVETGSHETLISSPQSLYRTIFARQYGEDVLPPTG
jgi:ATP-binding cassette subfamily B protein